MRRWRSVSCPTRISGIPLLLLAMAVVLSAVQVGCRGRGESRPEVVATTTMMGAVIREVGGDLIDVTVLVPPGGCPGHYDVRPGDVRAIDASRALIVHGYEGFVPGLIGASGKADAKVHTVDASGNWLVPKTHKQAGRMVCAVLSEIDEEHAAEYRRNCDILLRNTDRVEDDLLRKLKAAGSTGTAVICSDQQSPVLKWMGLNTIAAYGRPDEFTPAQLHRLVKAGRTERVRLVVDNLQSGPAAGRQLAEEIGATHVILSNFPDGFSNTPTWELCLRDSVDRVLIALADAGGESGPQ